MSKVKRNAPCPCGSGKKYKKCCMAKETAEPLETQKPAARAVFTDTEDSPGISASAGERVNTGAKEAMAPAATDTEELERPEENDPVADLWEEFKAADYERQVELFHQAVERFAGMDEEYIAEYAFEFLSRLHTASAERGERGRFRACIEAFRDEHPQSYERDIHRFLGWLIGDLVAEQRLDEVPPLAFELAAYAGSALDELNNIIRQLAYHGQFDTVREMMWIGWPEIRDSIVIMGWAADEFAGMGSFLELYNYVENAGRPDPNDLQLRQRVEHYYPELDQPRLEQYLNHLIGSAQREWSRDDFPVPGGRLQKRNQKQLAEDEVNDNLTLLSFEFVRYLHNEEGVSYSKAELVRSDLTKYIQQRNEGKLVDRGSMADRMLNPKWREPTQKMPEDMLCPDAETLDVFLNKMLNFMNPQHYKAAAIFELLPAWLRFLFRQNLIDEHASEDVLTGLQRLRDVLYEYWKKFPDDPAPAAAMDRWPS